MTQIWKFVTGKTKKHCTCIKIRKRRLPVFSHFPAMFAKGLIFEVIKAKIEMLALCITCTN